MPYLKYFLKSLLLPPGLFVLLLAVALLLMRRWRRLAGAIVAFVAAALFALSLPAVTNPMLQSLVQHQPWKSDAASADAGAIVVLTGGIELAPEYDAPIASLSSVQRARYAVYLHRRTRLPILVSGGNPRRAAISEAEAVRRLIEDDWRIPVRWVEDKSDDTEDSARLARAMLAQAGVRKVLLVTSALHMPRAELHFKLAGFQVVPAPTGFLVEAGSSFRDFLPATGSLSVGVGFLNEWLGSGWAEAKKAAGLL